MGDISDSYGGNAFEPGQHEKTEDFKPLPPGEYHMFIEKAEVKETKKAMDHISNFSFLLLEKNMRAGKSLITLTLATQIRNALRLALSNWPLLGRPLAWLRLPTARN